MTTFLRASMLSTFADCPRRAIALGPGAIDPANEDPDQLDLSWSWRPPDLRTLTAGVAPVIGTAVHKGAQINLTGGSIENAIEIAVARFRELIGNGVEYDGPSGCTPNSRVAERQIAAMVRVHAVQLVPRIQAERIEFELRGRLSGDYEMIAHPDVYGSGVLRDLKTGQRRWPASAQLGAAVILARANGLEVREIAIDYIPRCPDGKQDSARTIVYDVKAACAHAKGVIRQMMRTIDEFRASGDPETLPANPMSALCSEKYCPARGTNFCQAWKR